jgi:ribonuclease H2 subunit C
MTNPPSNYLPYSLVTRKADGTKVAYFRGRKLQGKRVKLPENYRGLVLEKESNKEPSEKKDAEDEDDAETGEMAVKAEFDEIIVWGHENAVDGSDPYLRSMEEWIGIADQVCETISVVDEYLC